MCFEGIEGTLRRWASQSQNLPYDVGDVGVEFDFWRDLPYLQVLEAFCNKFPGMSMGGCALLGEGISSTAHLGFPSQGPYLILLIITITITITITSTITIPMIITIMAGLGGFAFILQSEEGGAAASFVLRKQMLSRFLVHQCKLFGQDTAEGTLEELASTRLSSRAFTKADRACLQYIPGDNLPG